MPSVFEMRLDIRFLRQRNLMSEPFIRNLINQRKSFIQNTRIKKISREECLNLIRLEVDVMKRCDLAIVRDYIPKTWFIQDGLKVMNLMSNRIDHLYYSMFQMFSIGCVLLIEYMEFQSRYIEYITNKNQPLVVLMSNKKCEPQMYIAAGTFEYERHNIEMARKFFEEGIKHYTDNKNLYLEQLWIEVMHLGDVGGGELNETIAIKIYKNAIQQFDQDMEFHFLLLERSIEVKPFCKLQFEIVCDLLEIYKENDAMWHKVATLCSDGYIFDPGLHIFGHATDFKEVARCCILTYTEGLKHVTNIDRKRNLLKLLIEYLIKIWKFNKDPNNYFINDITRKEMKIAFQMGHYDLGGLHKPEYYVYWALISYDNRPEILQLAIERNRDNLHVWAEVLEYHIIHCHNYTVIKKVFDVGNQALGNKSTLLWDMMDTFLRKYCDTRLLGQFYKEGVKNPYQEISTVYKANYLSWCHMYYGIECARVVFYQLIELEPENKKLYTDMIVFEKQQQPYDVYSIRNLYNLTCSNFCHLGNGIGLWAEFIEFELTNVGMFSAEKLFKMALRSVKPHLRTKLKRRYRLIHEAHRRRTLKPVASVVIEISDEDN